MDTERKFITDGGIPVYVLDNPSQHGFFISLFARSGSLYESEENSGITHFLEHIAIRNVNRIMNDGLYSTLDAYGLEFNASTFSEMVQFYMSGASENFKVAADIIVRLFSGIELSREEIDAERGRIRAEIREADEKNSLPGFTAMHVWDGTPLSRPITGVAKSVGRVSRRMLEAHRQKTFGVGNIFFYITGRVSDSDIEHLLSLLSGYRTECREKHDNMAPVPRNFGKRAAAVYLKNADFTKVRFTFDLDMSRLTTAETDLLYEIVLGGYSSDFFIELSERRGLFYDISGSSERYRNIGTLSFSFELREAKLEEALRTSVELLKSLKENLLSEEKCMKAGFVSNAYMLYDDARELNFTFAYDNHILDLGYRGLADRREKYARVTPERIREVAMTVFTPDNLTLTLKGSKKRIDTEKLRKILLEL